MGELVLVGGICYVLGAVTGAWVWNWIKSKVNK